MKPVTLAVIITAFVLTFGVIAYAVSTNAPASTPAASATPNATVSPSSSQTTSNQSVTNAKDLIDPADAVTASQVRLKTTKGDILLDLYADTPKTVTNFVTLGKRGYYTSVGFHRIIKDFMIQGGDPTGTGAGGESIYGKKFPDEFPGTHKIVAGTLAMANAGAGTNGSQFFIVTESPQPHLDGKHTAFGQVADAASMDVVKAIAAVPVSVGSKPVEPVSISGFEIVK